MDLSEVTQNPHRHPWEMSRTDFLLKVLDGKVNLSRDSSLLDIGAGDLYFSIKAHGQTWINIDAVDNAFDEEESRHEGIRKVKHLDQVLGKKYDVICAMDVLEHIENDQVFLNVLLGMLKPGGVLLLTVPAFQFLFSLHDLHLKHFRRYHRGHVAYLIDDPKRVTILESFYFFHSLLYVRILEKLGQFFFNLVPQKKNSKSIHQSVSNWKFSERHPITRSLGIVLSIDATICRALAKMGFRLPGLSLCMVIQKN